MDRKNYIIGIFALVFLCSIVLLFIENSSITGHAIESTVSSVTIQQYYAISMSGNLSDGIGFGTSNSTASTDINATANHLDSDGSAYYMEVSSDSNSPVTFTVEADGPMNTSGGEEIGLGNESYYHAASTDLAIPAVASAISFTTSPQAAGTSVGVGDKVYYRFWLDIPAAVAVGTYNNTISVTGVAG